MKKEKLYIFIDDERDDLFEAISKDKEMYKGYSYGHCYNYEQAVKTLTVAAAEGADIVVDFDHDLGEGGTGYDVAKFIVENQIKLVAFEIHSMNPVGRENIKQLLTHYGYKQGI